MIHRDDGERVDVARPALQQALGCGFRREIVPMLDHRFATHRCDASVAALSSFPSIWYSDRPLCCIRKPNVRRGGSA
jgi:hypothetical protein